MRALTTIFSGNLNINIEHYFMFGEPVGEGATANMNVDITKLKEIFELAQIEK